MTKRPTNVTPFPDRPPRKPKTKPKGKAKASGKKKKRPDIYLHHPLSVQSFSLKELLTGKEEDFEDRIFENVRIKVSNNRYTNCKFRNCVLVFDGWDGGFDGVEFEGCTLEFDLFADTTISFLTSLYPTHKDMVEEVLEGIRKG